MLSAGLLPRHVAILAGSGSGKTVLLRRLVEEARAALGREALVLIDQEGGRVQRLKPPLCPNYPPGAAYGAIYDRDRDAGLRAAKLGALSRMAYRETKKRLRSKTIDHILATLDADMAALAVGG